MENKDSIQEMDIQVVGVTVNDFTDKDGKKVCGYSVTYLEKSQKNNSVGYVANKKWLSRENLDNKEKIFSKQFPFKTKLKYQYTSLSELPKILDIYL